MIIKFNQAVLEEARAENLARVELWDTDAKGLGFRVSASGRKLFCYKYFFTGKSYRITMGDYPVMDLAEARALALRWRGGLLEGNPPHLVRSGVKEQIIFPEIEYDKIDALRGMNISITTTAKTDDEAKALLAAFKFPFRN